MVCRTAPFSMTLKGLKDPKPFTRFQGQATLWRLKIQPANRKPYPSFQMVPYSMTLSDLWPTFQNHDNIQRQITRLIVSRVWSTQRFRFQWPRVTLYLDFKVTGFFIYFILLFSHFGSYFNKRLLACYIDAIDVLCAQLTRDLWINRWIKQRSLCDSKFLL